MAAPSLRVAVGPRTPVRVGTRVPPLVAAGLDRRAAGAQATSSAGGQAAATYGPCLWRIVPQGWKACRRSRLQPSPNDQGYLG